MNKILISYAYHQSKQAQLNLEFFLRHGYYADHPKLDYLLIVQGDIPPSLPSNTTNFQVIQRKNHGLDFEAWRAGLDYLAETKKIKTEDLVAEYDYFVFLNSSVCGPFLPRWWSKYLWPEVFTDKITEHIKLVGLTMNYRATHTERPTTWMPHLQSMFWVTDRVGLTLILKYDALPKINRLESPLPMELKAMTVTLYEVGLSRLFWSHNYRVKAICLSEELADPIFNRFLETGNYLLIEQNKDLFHGDIQSPAGGYFGLTLNPFETMFVKTNRIWTPLVRQYMAWLDQEKTLPDENVGSNENGLKIGFITTGWSPDIGGIISHTNDLTKQLIARNTNHRIYVLCLDSSDSRIKPLTAVDSLTDNGIWVRKVAYRYADYKKFSDLVANHHLDTTVQKWLQDLRLDLIHIHHLTGFGASILKVIKDANIPSIVSLHDYWLLDPMGQLFSYSSNSSIIRDVNDFEGLTSDYQRIWGPLLPHRDSGDDVVTVQSYRKYVIESLELPDMLITPSEQAKEVFVKAGIPNDRINVVENGIDVQEISEEVSRIKSGVHNNGANKRPLRLGILGAVLPSKGVLELMRAFIQADLPDLVLVIAGERPSYHFDNSYKEQVEHLAAIHTRIELIDRYSRDQLPSILAGLDGVAAPSLWKEVYGLSVREARAAQLPILVSSQGALPSATENDQAGLVVEQGGWVSALRKFVTDSTARAKWRAYQSQLQTSEKMAEELEGFYRDLN